MPASAISRQERSRATIAHGPLTHTSRAPGGTRVPRRHAVAATTPWRRSVRCLLDGSAVDANCGDVLAAGRLPLRSVDGLVWKLPVRTIRAKATRVPSPAWRRLPIGAELAPEGGAHFRVWAPAAAQVEVDLGERRVTSTRSPTGTTPASFAAVRAGMRYAYRLDGGRPTPIRHPASSPTDPTDRPRSSIRPPSPGPIAGGRACTREGQVLYEMHVGTFTAAGTWEAASRELPELARAGITVVEVLPVADFVGDFGWGYDGVDLFAPTRLYGRPDDFRAFVDRAHAVGLGVILDVVYNHLGPDGNYLGQYAPDYFSTRHRTDWGSAINFDGEGSEPVREFFVVEQRLLDRRVSPGRAPAGRHAGHPRRFPGARADGDRAPGAGERRPPIGVPRRRERAPGREARPPGGGRRLRPRRPLERRLPPLRHGRPHRTRRGLLQRPRRDAPGADLGRQARVSLPGSAIRLAGEAAGHARVGPRADVLHQLHPEPRPGRQFAGGAPLPPADQPRPIPRHDRSAPAGPGDSDAVPGSGVRRLEPLPLLRRPPARAGQADAGRAAPSSWPSFRAWPGPRPRPRCPIRPIASRSSARSSTSASASATAQRMPSTSTSCGCGGRTRCSGRRAAAAWTAPSSGPRRWSSGSSALGLDPDDRLLCLNLGRDLAFPSLAEPLLAPPEGMRWSLLWSSEAIRYGGAGTPEIDPADGWVLPGHAALVFGSTR